MNRTDRLLAILLELQARGWQRAEDLAVTFEVSKRTIYRDLDALSESGVPFIASPGKGYALDEGYFLPPLQFTSDEANLLLLGADFIAQTFDISYQQAVRSASSKIISVLTEQQRETVESMRVAFKYVALNPFTDDRKSEFLRKLRQAILDMRTVRFVYHTRSTDDPAGASREREADPYALTHYGNTWYVLAFCHYRKGLRNFRVDRMEDLTLLPNCFRRPPVDVTEVNSGRPYEINVHVVFAAHLARWAEEDRSYYRLRTYEDADGFHMILGARRIEDLVQWIVGWGGGVRVVEPPQLRDRIIEEARKILEVYQPPDSLLP